MVEQGTENPRVVGSIPTGGTISAALAHLVERHLAKVEVASSSLVSRSRRKSFVNIAFTKLFQLRDKREEIRDAVSANADGFKSGSAASREATAMRFARYVVSGFST